MSVPLYWFAFICLSYRWNAHHLLYTILYKYVDTPAVQQGSAHTDSHASHTDALDSLTDALRALLRAVCRYLRSDSSWHVDVLLWLALIGGVNGALGSAVGRWQWLLPLLFSLYLLALNLHELLAAIPVLERVQTERRESKATAAAAATATPSTAASPSPRA